MAKEYEVGEGYYLPVIVTDIGLRKPHHVKIAYNNGDGVDDKCEETIKNKPGLLLTAEEIAKIANLPTAFVEEGLTARLTELEAANASLKESLHEASEENSANDEALAQMNIKKAELEAENEKLKRQLDGANELLTDAEAQVKKLTEADCMRLQEFKPIIEERDKLKSELEQEKKRTQVWKDSAEEHRQRAEELEGDVNRYGMDIADNEVKIQRLGQENDSLKADIIELKAQLNVFGSRPSEIEELKAERDSAIGQADLFKSERDEFGEKIEKYKETLRKWTKKIRSQEEAIKQKDLIISLLAARVFELEKGGESNG